jgi:hypothetical protein
MVDKKTNIHPLSGIAFGVVDGRRYASLLEDIFDKGDNLTIANIKESAINRIAQLLCEMRNVGDGEDAKLERKEIRKVAEETHDALEWDYPDSGECEYEYQDSDGNQFRLTYGGGCPTIWCIRTGNIVQAHQCSPCYPNCGDLGHVSPDENVTCYGIPKRYREEES